MVRTGLVLGAILIAGCASRSAPIARTSHPVDHAATKAPVVVAPANPGVMPTAYRLAPAIDPDDGGYAGTISIDLSLADPTYELWLDSDGPRVTAATLDGVAVTTIAG